MRLLQQRPIVAGAILASAWWGLHGLATASHYRVLTASVGSPVRWSHALTTAMTSALIWVPITVAALWLVERHPVERGRWRHALALHIGAALAVVLLRALLVIQLNEVVGWYAALPPFRQILLTSAINNFFLYILVVAAAHALHYARAARARAAELSRAQLQVLSSQLQPHFLFNSLNTIAAMMHHDVAAADRMLARLSELLRRTLAAGDAPEVTLRSELELLSLFVDIETTRFPDRLSVQWDVDPGVLDLRVPHLVLQPLVENAVRHGIAPRAAAGTITISARRVGEWLYLEVADDGVGVREPAGERQGVGLANVRSRLAQLYPDRHHLELRARPDGGTVAAIVLPAAAGIPQQRTAPAIATRPAVRTSLADVRR